MSNYKTKLTPIRIGIFGDYMTGKSSVVNSFLYSEYDKNYFNIIDKNETKFNLNDGKEIKLILWDTLGQDRFFKNTLKTLSNINGVILVLDVTKKSSFNNINSWIKDFKENLVLNPIIILFGNKSDIEKKNWEVSPEEIKDYVGKINLPYFEVSAKNNQGIKEGISFLVNEIYEKFKEENNNKNFNLKKNIGGDKNNCVGKNKNK